MSVNENRTDPLPMILGTDDVQETLPTISNSDVDVDSDLYQTKKVDVGVMNGLIKGMSIGLKHVKTLDGLCKAALTTAKLLETRRKLMCLPCGGKGSDEQNTYSIPID